MHGTDGSGSGMSGGIAAGSARSTGHSTKNHGCASLPLGALRLQYPTPTPASASLSMPAQGGTSPTQRQPQPSSRLFSTASGTAIASDGDALPAEDDQAIDGDDPTGAWPVPHPSQGFVASAREGTPYSHDVVGGGATRIRVVVSDLDGTLLGPDKKVSARTLEAVRRAR